MRFSNELYDALNRVQRWLPALGLFYLTLARIWGLPGGDPVNETTAAVAALLAATLEVSSVKYYQTSGAAPADALEDRPGE